MCDLQTDFEGSSDFSTTSSMHTHFFCILPAGSRFLFIVKKTVHVVGFVSQSNTDCVLACLVNMHAVFKSCQVSMRPEGLTCMREEAAHR